MADNDTELDLSINVAPAERNIDRLQKDLESLAANLTQTAGLISAQMDRATASFSKSQALIRRDLAAVNKELEKSKDLTDRQRLRLEQRQSRLVNQINTGQDREVLQRERSARVSVQYGDDQDGRFQRQAAFNAFKAELNKQQQTILRYEIELRKDRMKAEIDAIRTQSAVIQAAIAEEGFKAKALGVRTRADVLQARLDREDERANRLVAEQDPVRRRFREGQFQNRVSREGDTDLQAALETRRRLSDIEIKNRYSVAGLKEREEKREFDAAYKMAQYDLANHNRRMDFIRKEANEEYRQRYGRNPDQAPRKYTPIQQLNQTPEAQAADLELARRNRERKNSQATMSDTEFRRKRAEENIPVSAQYFAQYTALAGVFASIAGMGQFVRQVEGELKQFQAISAATNMEMIKFKDTLLEVSSNSKFSTVEVAQAATVMAQAGLSLREVQVSLGSVIKLATASGSTLQESVDLVTSFLGTFNLQSSQTVDIANIMTEALNRTKLTVDKLALGVQYAGNVAADAGVSYSELTAILGALSNTGIRSGSTLGTGLRQLLIDVQKPSEQFQKTMNRLGITMADIDVKTNGFVGVLNNLRDAGFTAGDAINSFEVRAAAAFTGLSANSKQIGELVTAFNSTDAASAAAETQMESFSATFDRALNNVGNLAFKALEPTLALLQDLFKVIGDVTAAGLKLGPVFQILGTILASFAAVKAVSFLGTVLGALTGLTGASLAASGGVRTLTGSFVALTAAMRANPVFLAGSILTSVALAIAGFKAFGDSVEKSRDALKGLGNEVQGEIDSTTQTIDSLQKTIGDLARQGPALESNPIMRGAKIAEVKNAFKEWGIEINTTTGTIAQLIDKLVELEAKLQGRTIAQYTERLRINSQEQLLTNEQIGSGVSPVDREAVLQAARQSMENSNGSLMGRIKAGIATAPQLLDYIRKTIGGGVGQLATPTILNESNQFERESLFNSAQEQSRTVNSQILELERRRKTNKDGLNEAEEETLGKLKDQKKIIDAVLKNATAYNKLLAARTKLQDEASDIEEKRNEARARLDPAFTESRRNSVLGAERFNQQLFERRGRTRDPQAATELFREGDRFLIEQYEGLDNLRQQLEKQGFNPDVVKRIVEERKNDIDTTASDMMKRLADGFLKGLKDRLAVLEASGLKGGGEAADIRNMINRLEGPDMKNYRLSTDATGIQKQIGEAAQARGVSANYALRIAKLESSFNENALNKDSKAFGLYQFLPSTGANYGIQAGASVEAQTEAFIKFTQENRKYLQDRIGRLPTDEELALAHFAGKGGALDLIRADPNARAASVGFSGKKLSNNNLAQDSTVQQVIDKYLGMYRSARPDQLIEVGKRDEPLLANADATSKSATAGITTSLNRARTYSSPAEIRKLEAKIVDDFQKRLDADLKKYDELNLTNKDDPDVAAGRAEVISKNLEDKSKALNDLRKQVYKKEEDQIDERVKRAEQNLKVLQTSENVDNAGPAKILAAKQEVDAAKREAAVQKEALAVRYLNEVKEKLNLLEQQGITQGPQVDQLLSDRADAELRLKSAMEERAIAQTKVASLGYGEAMQQGTYNFLQQSGAYNSEGNIKSGAETFRDAWSEALSGVNQGLTAFAVSLAKAPKDAGQAFKQFGNMVIDMLMQMIAKALVLQITMSIFGDGKGQGGLFGGGGGGGFLSSIGNLFSTGFARGGSVKGGVPNRDSVYAKLMPGEVVMNTKAVKAVGEDKLLALNNMGTNIPTENKAPNMEEQKNNGGGAMVNVWVISPDQQPPMGPNDIIATVGENIQNKGSIKQLIKQVQIGAL